MWIEDTFCYIISYQFKLGIICYITTVVGKTSKKKLKIEFISNK